MNYLGWIPARWETMKLCFFRSGSTLRKQQIVTIHRYSPPRKSTTGTHTTNTTGPVHSHDLATPSNPAIPRHSSPPRNPSLSRVPLPGRPPTPHHTTPHEGQAATYRPLTAHLLTHYSLPSACRRPPTHRSTFSRQTAR